MECTFDQGGGQKKNSMNHFRNGRKCLVWNETNDEFCTTFCFLMMIICVEHRCKSASLDLHQCWVMYTLFFADSHVFLWPMTDGHQRSRRYPDARNYQTCMQYVLRCILKDWPVADSVRYCEVSSTLIFYARRFVKSQLELWWYVVPFFATIPRSDPGRYMRLPSYSVWSTIQFGEREFPDRGPLVPWRWL